MWCFLQSSMNEEHFKVNLHIETIHLESTLLFWRADEDLKGEHAYLCKCKYTQLWKV